MNILSIVFSTVSGGIVALHLTWVSSPYKEAWNSGLRGPRLYLFWRGYVLISHTIYGSMLFFISGWLGNGVSLGFRLSNVIQGGEINYLVLALIGAGFGLYMTIATVFDTFNEGLPNLLYRLIGLFIVVPFIFFGATFSSLASTPFFLCAAIARIAISLKANTAILQLNKRNILFTIIILIFLSVLQERLSIFE